MHIRAELFDPSVSSLTLISTLRLYLYLPQKKWGVRSSLCRNKDNQQVITESSHGSVINHSSLTDLKALDKSKQVPSSHFKDKDVSRSFMISLGTDVVKVAKATKRI